MSIGERRYRVTFQTATVTQDAYGEPDQTWTTLATRWALLQPMKSKERFSANQVQVDVDHRIVCRYDSTMSALTAGDRAQWNGRTYDIKSVLWRDHTRKELEIMAQEHVN